jgi:diaminopimelate decarboxylase
LPSNHEKRMNPSNLIPGINLEDLANEYGTPLYVYHAEKILEQYEAIKKSFEGVDLRIMYAAKALTNINILKLLRNAGSGLDAVSLEEVYLALKAGFQPHDILFTPNSVGFSEIVEAVDLGVRINIDNLSILEQFGKKYGNSVPVCARLNPHITAGGNAKIQTGHIDSKFGISILQLNQLKAVVDQYHIHIAGLHVHTGSDFLNADVFLQGAQIVFDAAVDFPDLEFIDFGSGFKVSYKEGDVVTDIKELGKKMTKVFKEFCKKYGRKLQIWFEPGKFLVSEAGFLLAKVNVVKITPVSVFVGLNTGLNHLIRPMMYEAYHDIVNISNPHGHKRIYNVVGYICETDTFGFDRKLNEVRVGDILAIKNAGAYGFSMSSNYNSRPRPAEVLIQNGKAHLIRKSETLEDLLQTQIDLTA